MVDQESVIVQSVYEEEELRENVKALLKNAIILLLRRTNSARADVGRGKSKCGFPVTRQMGRGLPLPRHDPKSARPTNGIS
jgi:hypothetical protein